MGRNGAPCPSVVRGAPAEQCHAYGKSLRSLAGWQESQQWSCIASSSAGLARQEVDDSKEVTSLKSMDTLKVRPGPLSSCSLPCGFA